MSRKHFLYLGRRYRFAMVIVSAWSVFSIPLFSQNLSEDEIAHTNSIELYHCDSKISYDTVLNGQAVRILLENTPDRAEKHVLRNRVSKDGGFDLVDGAQRFDAGGVVSRLSRTEVWWGGSKINLPGYPNNQIFNFFFKTYGARNVMADGPAGLYFLPNSSGTSVLINLAQITPDDASALEFSAIMIGKTGRWQIYPPSQHFYESSASRKITVLKEGGADFPGGGNREVQYESEWNQRKIKLVLKVAPDRNENHTVGRKVIAGQEEVLVDGARAWYDPAGPIISKLTKVQAWWDGKPVQLKNFPENHFFNVVLDEFDLTTLGRPFNPAMPDYENLVGVYPSTDAASVYLAMARRDPVSKELSYGVLIIQEDGQCEIFPGDFQTFHNDVGQGISVLEGYSKRALTVPTFPGFVKGLIR